MFAACCIVLLAFIHSCYCTQNNFYENDNFVDHTPDTSSVSLSNVRTIRLTDKCGDNAIALNISAAGTIDFFPDQQQVSGNRIMRFYPLSVNSGDVDSSMIKSVARAEFSASDYGTQLFAPFDASFRNYSQFDPGAYTIVEWRIELSFGSSTNIPNLINLFQMFLATNGTSSLVVFLYDKHLLQWGNPSMGIDVCDQKWEHPLSSMNGILNDLANGSNINVPGQWMFMIENGELIEPTPCSVGCSFITGTCSEPNTCSCVSGWEGVNCTTPSCPGGCVNGMCNEPFVCTCDDGWRTGDCSVAKCSNSCTNGMCEMPYICKCDNGWEDENCTTPICSSTCSEGCGNGTCIGPDDCECKEGYLGQCCDVVDCLGGSDCQGFCRVPGECICHGNDTGILCEIKPTEPPTEPTEENTDPPGTTEAPNDEGLSGAAIGGIIAGIIGFVVLIILLVFFIVCVLCCFYS